MAISVAPLALLRRLVLVRFLLLPALLLVPALRVAMAACALTSSCQPGRNVAPGARVWLRMDLLPTLILLIPIHQGTMPPSTRDLLASVLGELPVGASEPASVQTAPAPASPHPSRPPEPLTAHPGPWRVTAKMSGNQVQISNHRESRVVPKEQVEVYLRGHGPARRR